jgi:hypothetical protein
MFIVLAGMAATSASSAAGPARQFAQAAPIQSTPLPPLATPSPSAPKPTVTTPASPEVQPSAGTHTTQSNERNAAMEQRIRSLQTELNITTEQMPQWNAFAQTMRDNANSTDQLFQARANAAASMNALQNMQSYAATARQYAENTQALATAFESLYDGLSPEQKQLADKMFRQQATQNAAKTTTK